MSDLLSLREKSRGGGSKECSNVWNQRFVAKAKVERNRDKEGGGVNPIE